MVGYDRLVMGVGNERQGRHTEFLLGILLRHIRLIS